MRLWTWYALGIAALLVATGCKRDNTLGTDAAPAPDSGVLDASPRPEHAISDGPGDDRAVTDGPPTDGPQPTQHYFPANLHKDVDILFVVDNSTSMIEEQQALAQAFPQFVDMLATLSGGMPDVHIGVTSPDLGAGNYNLPSCEVAGGDKGKLWNTPQKSSCTPPTDPYISYLAGATNVPGSGNALDRIKAAFSCIAEIGTGGCGFEHTIEASRRAVDPQLGINPGFVRPGALLVVVYVTDEDDCSAQKPQLFDPSQQSLTDPLGPLTSFRCFEFGVECTCSGGPCTRTTPGPRTNCKPAYDWLHKIGDYVTFFKGLKAPGQVVMAALAGPITPVEVILDGQSPQLKPSCNVNWNNAVPAIRIKALVDAFGSAGFFHVICNQPYGPPLKQLGTIIASQLGEACLQPLTDTDPGKPGMQASCVVEDVVGTTTTAIPACGAQTGPCNPCPCWRVVADPSCSALGGHALEVARSSPAAPGTIVSAKCLGPK
jgi:hypothetical protein